MNDELRERVARLSPEKRELVLRRLAPRGRGAEPIATVPRDLAGHPLSSTQARLWFFEQLEPGSGAYTLPGALSIDGALDVAALSAAFDDLARRHETLRTTFHGGDRPVQKIEPEPRVRLEIVDALGATESELQGRLRAFARVPFDFEAGPPWRVALYRTAPEQHVLAFTTHHLISDGWSMTILARDLVALYAARRQGRPAALPPMPVQYVDTVPWREAAQARTLDSDLAHFRELLTSPFSALDIPTDRPRPRAQGFRGRTATSMLSTATASAVRAFARARSATPFMILCAGYAALLARQTGQHDLVVGTPVAGRPHPDLEGLIGLFVNTVALRFDVAAAPTFEALVAQVRERSIAALAHEALPFERLIEAISPPRDLSRPPVFQTMFVFQNTAPPKLEAEGLTLTHLRVDAGTSKLDLTLTIEEVDGALLCSWEYDSDLFDETTIARLASRFTRVLDGALESPGRPIVDLEILSEDDRATLAEMNQTARVYDLNRTLHARVEEQVDKTPEAIAVVDPDGATLSYRELDGRANAVARWVAAHNSVTVQASPRLVGVFAERSFEMVVALLGALKAGGAFVPLDPSLPDERLAFMLEELGAAPVLVQNTTLAERLAAISRVNPVLVLEGVGVAPRTLSVAGPDDLAYAIYTSGSTGKPKAALNTHRGIVNRLLWMQDEYGLSEHETVAQKTPFGFDVSVWEFFWPLLVGARLALARPGGHVDPAYLARFVVEREVTTIHFVPSMLRAFIETPGFATCTSLARVLASGEALSTDVARRFFERSTAELHNLYGPTEAAVDVTFWRCPRPDPVGGHADIPIGRPIANTRVWVLDEAGRPQPIGVRGELWIAGVAVGDGYLARPELTAERFVSEPATLAALGAVADRAYRTGDIASVRPGGVVAFHGRADDQVKVRGVRVELGEIEAVVAEHPSIVEVAVALREVAPGDARLVAYVALASGADATDGELRAHVKKTLPDAMAPSFFVRLPALPRTASGKVDRRALQAPSPRARLGPCEPPSGALEGLIASLFADVLAVPEVGRHDGFFELGGHSLLVLTLAHRLTDALDVEVPIRAVFEGPTIAALAESLRRGVAEPASLEERAAVVLSVAALSEDDVDAMLAEGRDGD